MLALIAIVALAQTPQHRLFMQPNLPRSAPRAPAALSIGNAITAGDRSGNWWQLNTDGTTQAGSSVTMTPIGGPGVSPLTFNGTSQRYESSVAVAFPIGDYSTVTVVNLASTPNESVLVAKFSATLYFTCDPLGAVPQTPKAFTRGSSASLFSTTSSTSVAPGTWACIGVSYNGTTGALTLRIYGSGNQTGTVTGGGVQAGTDKHSFGGSTNNIGWLSGMSRGAFFTEKALSDADIDRICAGAL